MTLATKEPKNKRAKILSACGECRRKKTKCDGEQPCHNCRKSKSECMYSSANNHFSGNEKKTTPSKETLEAIEMRLKAIEDMLRIILEQTQLSSASSTCSTDDNTTVCRLPSIQNLSKYDDFHIPLSLHGEYKPTIILQHDDHFQPIKKRKRVYY